MRDDLMGGLLATAIAAPMVVVCCGGGGLMLAWIIGTVGAIGGWMSGLGGIAVLIAAAGATLTWRTLRRRNSDAACVVPSKMETEHRG